MSSTQSRKRISLLLVLLYLTSYVPSLFWKYMIKRMACNYKTESTIAWVTLSTTLKMGDWNNFASYNVSWFGRKSVEFVVSGGGRQCGRDHTTIYSVGRTCVWEMWSNVIRTHREREAQRGITLLTRMQQLQNEPTFTKGYKVTLYSDSLRATALYANYISGPNLGYQRG